MIGNIIPLLLHYLLIVFCITVGATYTFFLQKQKPLRMCFSVYFPFHLCRINKLKKWHKMAIHLIPRVCKMHDSISKQAKNKHKLILTIGVFFDGTGNNASNIDASHSVCSSEYYSMSTTDARSALAQCVLLNSGHSSTATGSYLGYYTNIYWLSRLYTQIFSPETGYGQCAIYINGVGTEDGLSDNSFGLATGTGETGIVKKTDMAVTRIGNELSRLLKSERGTSPVVIEVQFDIFGFSRGAAAARHFANRVFGQDEAIVSSLKSGLGNVELSGMSGGKTRFIGLFDTVSAIGTPINGLNPHNADTGNVNIALRPGVAEKVFHITARHECRFNFALNSIKPAWPELALPGAHSDIGGGYYPEEQETYFLTRPRFETVPLSMADTDTRIYRQLVEHLRMMDTYPAVAPILKCGPVKITTWYDDRMPANHYGALQKRSGAALTIDRLTYNDWSKVVLRVMLDAAQEAGGVFAPLDETAPDFALSSELYELSEKARTMGRAARNGQSFTGFTTSELQLLAGKFLHCSANWNAVVKDDGGRISGAVKPAKLITFPHRPDEHWQRTIYDMNGNKVY